MKKFHPKNGITLTEILLGVVILAVSFLPIIGVMGSSIKGTQKDEEIVKAVHLAQTSLNTALQFPFNQLIEIRFPSSPGPTWNFTSTTAATVTTTLGDMVFSYGQKPLGKTTYNVALRITDVGPTFRVPTYDPASKALNLLNPSAWNWQTRTTAQIFGVYHRYELTVTWKDAGNAQDRFYRLVSFKAKLAE